MYLSKLWTVIDEVFWSGGSGQGLVDKIMLVGDLDRDPDPRFQNPD